MTPLLYGIPYATDEAYRDAYLRVGGQRFPVRLPVSRSFGPAHRQETAVKFGAWKMTIQPRPWRYVGAFFEVDVRIDGPEAQFLIPEQFDYSTWHPAATGKPSLVTIPYLAQAILRQAEIVRVEEAKVELIAESKSPGSYSLRLPSGEVVFDWKSGIPWDRKDVIGLKCLNVLAFHSSGYSEVESARRVELLKDGERVKAILYRPLTRYRVDIPIDIPPVLSQMYMRGRG